MPAVFGLFPAMRYFKFVHGHCERTHESRNSFWKDLPDALKRFFGRRQVARARRSPRLSASASLFGARCTTK